MDDQNKNLILATVLSFLVILVWFVLFPPEQQVVDPNAPAEITNSEGVPIAQADPVAGTSEAAIQSQAEPETQVSVAPRVAIETPSLSGSISLAGGRLDDLSLKGYRETLDEDSENVTLLKPFGVEEAYYTLFGWAPGGDLGYKDVPGPDTLWRQVGGTTLTPDTPVELSWDNGNGLRFQRTISVDQDFLFTVTQAVENNSSATVRIAPYSELVRHGEPSDLMGFFIIHEGAIRQSGEEMNEFNYKDIPRPQT